MDFLKKRTWLITGFLAGIYLIGVIGLSVRSTRSLFEAATPFTLLISLVMLALFHEKYSTRFVAVALIIFAASLAIEIIGVATGQVFGYYEYGSTLGIKVMDTPLLIGVNWLILVYMVWVMLGELRAPSWLICLLGPAVMVLYDYLLEPVAIWTDMWNWGGEVPVKNYFAWALISFVFFILIALVRPAISNKLATPLFIIQFVFFLLLNLVLMYFN